jgi:hypothetical protein
MSLPFQVKIFFIEGYILLIYLKKLFKINFNSFLFLFNYKVVAIHGKETNATITNFMTIINLPLTNNKNI